MKRNKKKIIVGISILLVIILVGVIWLVIQSNKKEDKQVQDTQMDYYDSKIDMNYTENAEIKDGRKIATSEKLKEEKTYNDLQIIDAEITSTSNRASFMARIKNNLDKPVENEIVYIVLLNKDGSEMLRLETYFPDIEAKGEGQITATTNEDIANAYDYYIERKVQ